MRLSEDAIRQGLLHPDREVRCACLHYFAEGLSRNLAVMPTAIEALQRFGRSSAFSYSQPLADLPQTDDTLRWVIGELQTQPRRSEAERYYMNTLFLLLCQADVNLLLPHEAAIRAAPGFSQDRLVPFTHRLELLSWDGAALWRELEVICDEGKNEDCAVKMRYAEAERIVEALGRQGGRHAGRMMSLLAVEVEEDSGNPLAWMEPLMVRLAGELRHEPAIPLVVAKLHLDVEVVSEECQTALIQIGTDAAVQSLWDACPTAEWHFRLYACGILGRIHTDLAVAACIALLEKEPDLDLQNWFAQSLVEQFSFEGNETARQVLLSDPDLYDLQQVLVPACTLMGQDFPELEAWRKEIEETIRSKPFLYPSASIPAPPVIPPPAPERPRTAPVIAEKKAGRNDPCPCGSGKKFKKCCLNRKTLF